MAMIDIEKLSDRYDVRRLGSADVDGILKLCRENTQFYEYCEAEPTEEQILRDMRLLPPGIRPSDKYYVGFYRHGELIALLDLVDGYPAPDCAYIGFFMMKKALQGQGLGSAVIRDCAAYLQSIHKTAVRLAIDKANPQSTHFWKKNGFRVVREADRNGRTLLVAEKTL